MCGLTNLAMLLKRNNKKAAAAAPDTTAETAATKGKGKAKDMQSAGAATTPVAPKASEAVVA